MSSQSNSNESRSYILEVKVIQTEVFSVHEGFTYVSTNTYKIIFVQNKNSK